uniref:(California timema) hypothetical protein n=1 Tax=Timema californicum TaxID=61474 RepID=A0A7R9J310_TIMCA|nr:unnamed protein product [Timema californicum]
MKGALISWPCLANMRDEIPTWRSPSKPKKWINLSKEGGSIGTRFLTKIKDKLENHVFGVGVILNTLEPNVLLGVLSVIIVDIKSIMQNVVDLNQLMLLTRRTKFAMVNATARYFKINEDFKNAIGNTALTKVGKLQLRVDKGVENVSQHNLEQLMMCNQVCQQWQQISQDPALWKELIYTPADTESYTTIISTLRQMPGLQNIDLSKGPHLTNAIEERGDASSSDEEASGTTKAKKTHSSSESESSEEESEDETKGKKGVESLIQIENPNRVQKKVKKLATLNETVKTSSSTKPELSRREREEVERQRAQANYQRLHAEGKTEEARADLARLAIIKQQREEAAKQREQEKKRTCFSGRMTKGVTLAIDKVTYDGEIRVYSGKINTSDCCCPASDCMFSEMLAGAARLEQDRALTRFDATVINDNWWIGIEQNQHFVTMFYSENRKHRNTGHARTGTAICYSLVTATPRTASLLLSHRNPNTAYTATTANCTHHRPPCGSGKTGVTWYDPSTCCGSETCPESSCCLNVTWQSENESGTLSESGNACRSDDETSSVSGETLNESGSWCESDDGSEILTYKYYVSGSYVNEITSGVLVVPAIASAGINKVDVLYYSENGVYNKSENTIIAPRPMTSLVLTDSSKLTSDSQHLVMIYLLQVLNISINEQGIKKMHAGAKIGTFATLGFGQTSVRASDWVGKLASERVIGRTSGRMVRCTQWLLTGKQRFESWLSELKRLARVPLAVIGAFILMHMHLLWCDW